MFPVVLFLVTQSAVSSARVWYVVADGSGDAPTIQEAIDAASAGDEVLVAPGNYGWSTQGGDSTVLSGPTMLTMRSGIALRSQSGAQLTTLDAEGKGRLIRFEVANNVRLEGFTLRGGNAAFAGAPGPHSNGAGGAILCRFSSGVEIVANVVRENYAWGGAGGIAIVDSHAEVRGNIVSQNLVGSGTGGISITGAGANVTVELNTIAENGGGGVFCFASTVALAQNLIVANPGTAQLQGYGVECFNANVTLVCNNSWQNPDGDYPCGGSAGNFSDDPLICDNVYRLQAESPCLPENNICGVQIGAGGECIATDAGVLPLQRSNTWVLGSPNPFKPDTRITYGLQRATGRVRLDVFDARGRWVTQLVDRVQSNVVESVVWDGRDDRGQLVAAGVYIVRLRSGPHATTTKVVLAK